MGDLLRRAVYPVLLISIVGGLWRLASNQGDLARRSNAGLPALPPVHYTDPPETITEDSKPEPASTPPSVAETDR
jgi:hypothetical protein